MKIINYNFEKTLKILGIKTRPNASSGFWVMFLLPISIIVSYFRNPEISSIHYKYLSLTSGAYIISSIILIVQCVRNNNFNGKIPHIINAIYLASLFYSIANKGVPFSIISAFILIFSYTKGVFWVLRSCPQSFTFGEAAILVQGTIMFIFIAFLNIPVSLVNVYPPTKVGHICNTILQVGLLGVITICFITYKYKIFRKMILFYVLVMTVVVMFVLFPLHFILQINPLLWVLQFLTKNTNTIRIVIFWVICSTMAVIALSKQISSGKKANTKTRKIFHILAVIVMIPGLIEQCTLLYLASGCILAIFIALETLRIINVPPLGSLLQDGFAVFADVKDAGGIALTPIYLLVGCSIPIWIHPEPCDVTDSAGFNLLPLMSGLLTVGIGDTMASVFGIMFGKRKWLGTDKTIEGTLACIFGQLSLVMLLMNFGFILKTNENIIRALLAAIISSIVEAKTDQVDNLVLPLISYIILV